MNTKTLEMIEENMTLSANIIHGVFNLGEIFPMSKFKANLYLEKAFYGEAPYDEYYRDINKKLHEMFGSGDRNKFLMGLEEIITNKDTPISAVPLETTAEEFVSFIKTYLEIVKVKLKEEEEARKEAEDIIDEAEQEAMEELEEDNEKPTEE